MSEPAIKLTAYFSERDRVLKHFVADALIDVYERHRMRTSVLLRGSEGFGHRSRLTDRMLTLSESLPLASVAVDQRARVEAALPEVSQLVCHGVITLERAQLLSADELERPSTPDQARPSLVKVSLYGGRSVRAGGRSGYVEAIDRLRRSGAVAASVLLAVDGTLHGERRRARFFARNASVPLMLMAVGEAGPLYGAIPELAGLLDEPVATVERVQVCKIAGESLSEPARVRAVDSSGLSIWQKLMVHVDEQARYGSQPLYRELIRRIHAAGGAGATALRGVRGFYADREPLFDRFLSLRRHVPVVVVMIDTPENVSALWPIVDELTSHSGVVTSELVPASTGLAGDRNGRLALARTPAVELLSSGAPPGTARRRQRPH